MVARKPTSRSRYGGRPLALWVVLLAQAQLADSITTEVDRLHGGIESNHVAAFILSVGGPGLFLLLKLLVVAAMGLAVVMALRYRRRHPGVRAERCLDFLALTLQGSVALLTITALGNAHLAVQIASASVGST